MRLADVYDYDASHLPDFFVNCTVPAAPKAVEFAIHERWRTDTVTLAYQTPLVGDLYGTGVPVAVVAGNLSYSIGRGVPARLASGIRIVPRQRRRAARHDRHAEVRLVRSRRDCDRRRGWRQPGRDCAQGQPPQHRAGRRRGRLVAYGYDPVAGSWSQRWVSNERYDNAEGYGRAGAAIGLADFNNDGATEVFVGNQIFNAQTGVRLVAGGAADPAGCPLRVEIGCFWSQTVAVDMDGDGLLELVAGNVVYGVTISNTAGAAGNAITVAAQANPAVAQVGDGWSAVVDMDLDGRPDVVVVRTATGRGPARPSSTSGMARPAR